LQQRGRHQSDDSVTNDSSTDDSEPESGGDERDEAVAQENVQPEVIQFTTELAPGLSRQWLGLIVRMDKRNGAGKALVVDLDKSDMQNGSKEA
jgi:hypothetical protein